MEPPQTMLNTEDIDSYIDNFTNNSNNQSR